MQIHNRVEIGYRTNLDIHGLAKRWSLGCVNLLPAARGNQEAGFTQPRDHLLADPCRASTDAGGDVARGRGLVGVGADGEDAAGHRGEHPQRHLRLLGRHRRKRDISRPSESCTVVQSGNAGFD